MTSTSYNQYLASCCTIAHDAGKLLMGYFTGTFETSRKADNSPVTEADVAANNLIVKALSVLTPNIPIIAEEDATPGREDHEQFWLVDPLDGTRSFVRGEPEFTVNIGLIKNKVPVLGVIYGPPQGEMYWGEVGQGAYRQIDGGQKERINVRPPASDGVVVVRSKSHPSKATEAFLQTLKIKDMVSGSSSIKFCRVAEGNADIYPRFGRTMEWDTAAGHAILQAAGGKVETSDGKPLMYGKSGFENPSFIAYGKSG
jgi:3'(2'), 5'-bisphosphate nucleotidase